MNPYLRLSLTVVALAILVLLLVLLTGDGTICRGVGYDRECMPF